jgi:hypothetical protein
MTCKVKSGMSYFKDHSLQYVVLRTSIGAAFLPLRPRLQRRLASLQSQYAFFSLAETTAD